MIRRSLSLSLSHKKALPKTGRPLTIACHISSYFLAALSVLTADVSVAAAVVSGTGATVVFVSTVDVVTVSVVVDSSVELSPHAAKAPIANTKRSFFIVPVFVFLMFYLVLIPSSLKGNPPPYLKLKIFLGGYFFINSV